MSSRKRARDNITEERVRHPAAAGANATQQRKRGTPSDGRRGGRTKRRRSGDQAPEGASAPSQARAGGAGIPQLELLVGETIPPEEPLGGLPRQEHA